MKIDIRGSREVLPEGARAQAERKVRLMLGRWGERLGRVTVRLDDVNGPRGGVDKLCRIEARLDRSRSVVIEEVGADQDAALARAADRLASAVSRAVARDRDLAALGGSPRTEE